MRRSMRRLPWRLGALLTCAGLCACGGSGASGTDASHSGESSTAASHLLPGPAFTATRAGSPAVAQLPAAERPQSNEFPAPAGRSLKQLALVVKGTAQFGAGPA